MNDKHIRVLTVSDLHQDIGLVDQLTEAVNRHEPDLVAFVGDFLEGSSRTENKYSIEQCARIYSSLPAPDLVFVKGNHDHEKVEALRNFWKGRPFNVADRDVFVFGPLHILCFPCLLGDFNDEARVNAEPEVWLPQLIQKHGTGFRNLWLMHEPPKGTPLSAPSGVLAGNLQWMEMVERYEPRIVVFGHDHDTPLGNNQWNCRLETGTFCIGLGQGSILRHAVLDFSFEGEKLRGIRVKAYPAGETVRVFPQL